MKPMGEPPTKRAQSVQEEQGWNVAHHTLNTIVGEFTGDGKSGSFRNMYV